MKVLDVVADIPVLTAKDDRYFQLENTVSIRVFTDEGTLHATLLPGFLTNFRSGPGIVDCFINHIGKPGIAICWLFHDFNYGVYSCLGGEHPVSKELADDILRQMLILEGMSKGTARIVYGSVKLFGKDAYEEVDKVSKNNMDLGKFEWTE